MFSTYKEISVTKLESVLQALSTPGALNVNDYDLLVYGGGGKSRSYYSKLSNDTEVEILWTGWCGPKWTSFLSFIPGQVGLVKVLKPSRLKSLFEDLASHSVSDLYYVPKALTERIKRVVISAPSSHNSKKILENEMSFLYLQCEMDETVMRNGQEYFQFDFNVGPNLAENIKNLFEVAKLI